jgi:small acid-soluble spore protein (thioredoxin-like protein)
MKGKFDDQSDNVEHIQKNINHTIGNMDLAEEMIKITDGARTVKSLEENNQRRSAALQSIQYKLKYEADNNKNI